MGKGQNTLSSPVVGSTERGRSPQEETLCRARAGCLGQEPSADEVLQLCREGDASGLSEQLSEMSICAVTQGFGKKKIIKKNSNNTSLGKPGLPQKWAHAAVRQACGDSTTVTQVPQSGACHGLVTMNPTPCEGLGVQPRVGHLALTLRVCLSQPREPSPNHRAQRRLCSVSSDHARA